MSGLERERETVQQTNRDSDRGRGRGREAELYSEHGEWLLRALKAGKIFAQNQSKTAGA